MFAVLREQHPDRILLGDGASIPLTDGLVVEPFEPGTRITIVYNRDTGGAMVVESVKRTARLELA